MKNLFLAFALFLVHVVVAQNNCQTAKPFCAGGVSGETFPATTNAGSAQSGPNYGCLGSQPNPSWYFLQISQSGNLDILIQGQITTPPPASPGQDVDFICWGPFNSLNGICDSLTANKIVDCSYSGSFTETLNIPTGVTGQYYMVLITNFANATQDIVFTQFAGTGSTNCGLLGSNSKICAGSSATIVATNSGSLTSPVYSITPLGLTNNNGTFVVTPTVTTNYTLYISGTNNLNQPTTQTAVAHVTVNPMPSAAPQVTNTTCTSTVNNLALNLSFLSGGVGTSYTVNWSPTPNGIGSAQQQTLTGGINANTYNATVTAQGGCSVATSLTITPTPEPAVIDIQPPAQIYSLTCLQPVWNLSTSIATNNYTWANGQNTYFTGQFASLTFTNTGTYTVSAVNPLSGCTSTAAFVLSQNTLTPTSTLTPAFQNITCSLTSIQNVTMAATPTVNVSQVIYSPLGGSLIVNSNATTYPPLAPGIYTHCAVNDVNGCQVCKQFTVVASQGFPKFDVSSPQSFTLGCNTKSVAVISINNAVATNSNQVPTGGAVSYTLLPPGASTVTPGGPLGATAVYTVNAAGIYTVITKDNSTFCETRLPISILSNTAAPNVSAVVPYSVLNCDYPRMTLQGQSTNTDVAFNWLYGASLNQPGDTVGAAINPSAPSSTLIGTYTLQVTDNSSTCRSTSLVPIYQNIVKPLVLISNGGGSVTCNTPTITLTNQSQTGITAAAFPKDKPVVAQIWRGPTPQLPLEYSTVYVGYVPGTFTLVAKDLNNGCINSGTVNIADNKKYPSLVVPKTKQYYACGVTFDTLFVDVQNATKDFTYFWQPPPNVAIKSPTTNPLLATSPGVYKLVVLNSINGCATSTEAVLYADSLTSDFSIDTQEGFVPFETTFKNLTRSRADNNNVISYWNFGNGTFSTTPSASLSPLAHYSAAGTYTVKLFSFKGVCSATSTHTILVNSASALSIPNVFTPNGDNVNDVYFLDATNLSELYFMVTDRWGHMVYELSSASGNIAWDGKNQKGVNCSEGVYFYKLKAKGTDGQTYDTTGTINLMR